MEEIGQGGGLDGHLTFEELVPDYLHEHALRSERSLEWAEDRVVHLQRFFGRLKVIEITPNRRRAYQKARLAEGASPAIINRDLGALRRMFTLAVQAEKLHHRPQVSRLPKALPQQEVGGANPLAPTHLHQRKRGSQSAATNCGGDRRQ